ncbi:flagellar hook assembly protein FlgD [Paractinoplanes durhamensis]|uniref:flagellar hook assembly protein FlgD n=1 Tax=Paractinoplanes durhamensis TaxID=113563 RepID=UPI001EF17E0A|nr:flagellar hook capping FlgD N-terminal domain-containing protein [Actinoplanes durhamensis]
MSGPSASEKAKGKELGDKDTFLKLLVAQLKYQDPSNPADSTQFLAQTAQFTQVEKLGDIADMLKSQRMIGVSSLVGHEVTFMDANGARQSGTVSAAKLNGDSEPMLRVGNTDVQLSKVMEVQSLGQSGGAAAANVAGAAVAAAGLAGSAAAAAAGPVAPKSDDEDVKPTTGPATA